MADFYRNIDQLGCVNEQPLTAKGVQYDEVDPVDYNAIVDLVFFKEHARIDFDTDDTLCRMYIDAAIDELQDWAQLSFGVRTMRLRAKSLPNNYKIMYGRVDTITTSGYSNTGDLLDKGGSNIDITYTTIGKLNNAIKIAICRYAAGLYINRETITETKFAASALQDEAKVMLRPYMNITLC